MVKIESIFGRRNETKKKLPSLDELIERDPNLEMDAEIAEHFASQIMDRFEEKGWEVYEDPQDAYRELAGPVYIRRESPQRLMSAIVQDQPIELKFSGPFGEKYLNAALWSKDHPEIMRWTVLEGWSRSGGIYMVEGFSVDSLNIEEHKLDIPKEEMTRVMKGAEEVMLRTSFRSLSGKVEPSDLRFVLLGVVAQRFPIDQMTIEERERFEEFEIDLQEWQDAGQRGQRPDPFYITRVFMPRHEESEWAQAAK